MVRLSAVVTHFSYGSFFYIKQSKGMRLVWFAEVGVFIEPQPSRRARQEQRQSMNALAINIAVSKHYMPL